MLRREPIPYSDTIEEESDGDLRDGVDFAELLLVFDSDDEEEEDELSDDPITSDADECTNVVMFYISETEYDDDDE